MKKGPWTPEEDLVLVSHIQEHGPGNWRAVPTRTGTRRRLRESEVMHMLARGRFCLLLQIDCIMIHERCLWIRQG
jgi:hypothetical protein